MIPDLQHHCLITAVAVALACGGLPATSEPDPPATPTAQSTADAEQVVARWNGGSLTATEVREHMSTLSPTGRAALTDLDRRRALVDRMLTNRLLFDEGRRRGYTEDPDIVRQVDALRERLVIQRLMREIRTPPRVPDADARAYYDDNRLLYSTTQVRASHILVPDEATAIQIAMDAHESPERFADLARTRSTDALSAKRGGDLGLFGPGRMPADFERVAFALAEGEISQPVRTRYGWHVILITERHEGETRPFESVKAQITSLLANRSLEAKVEATVAELRAGAAIEIDDATLAAIEPPPSVPVSPHAGMAGH